MKIVRTNLTPWMIVILVILAILFAVVIIPILVIGGVFWFVCKAVTDRSPLDLYLRSKDRRRSGIREEAATPDRTAWDASGGSSASDDETIECEVISSRTFDENGQEIR